MSFELIPTGKNHIESIAELEKMCFSVPESKKSLEESLQSDMALYFTAFSDGAFVGYITSYVSFDTADILSIAVAEEHRRKGFGRMIMLGFIGECKKRGIARITLEVRQSNSAAKGLYESIGFFAVGKRKGYYTLPKEDAVLYDLDITSAKISNY